jgi:hypothetical protein
MSARCAQFPYGTFWTLADKESTLRSVAGRNRRGATQGSMHLQVSSATGDMWPVPYGDGLAIWRRFTATFDVDGWPIVELDMVVEDGEARIDRFELRRRPSGPVSARTLREISIPRLIELAVGSAVMRRTALGTDKVELTPIWRDDPDRPKLSRSLGEHIHQERRQGGRPPKRTPDRVERILRLWTESEGRKGRADWVAQRADVSRSTVYETVRNAKEGT